jgi:signal transduction histidine kinase
MNADSANLSKGDILIIDDSPDNLRVLSTTLTEQGYEVRCVKSGTIAMIGIQTSPPDLILLDIRMPEVDGYEVCRRIKADPGTAEIPVVFLSALDEVLDKVKAFQVGGADYITKPFQIQEVLARVENQLTIRRLQKQLIQKNQHLQQEIYEHQQTEAALRAAKEAAEAASYAKSAFLAQMSHELRTPLNHILGFTGLLQEESLTATQQDYLNKIYSSSRHLLKLINNILTITKNENKQLSLNQQDFDLFALLQYLKSIWQLKIEDKNLSFIIEFAANTPAWIHTDKDKLTQILNSVLDNAFRFTVKGSIIMRVSAIKPPISSIRIPTDTPDTDSVMAQIEPFTLKFEIEDTGLDIVDGELSQLFKLFSDSEMDHEPDQGTGLGLSITRQFIQRLGGDIAVLGLSRGCTLVSFSIQAFPAIHHSASFLSSSSDQSTRSASDPASFRLSSSADDFAAALNSEMLQVAMPDSWIIKLHHAAIKGFDHQILQLLREIPAAHTQIAEILGYWTDNFYFDRIIHLTKPVIEKQVIE